MKKIFAIIAVFSLSLMFSQQKMKQSATIAFLNVENLWDTIRSADYIDGTKDFSNPAFHRSVPLDSVKFLDVTDRNYKGEWSDYALKGKKSNPVSIGK